MRPAASGRVAGAESLTMAASASELAQDARASHGTGHSSLVRARPALGAERSPAPESVASGSEHMTARQGR
jgi:hypothetical protein